MGLALDTDLMVLRRSGASIIRSAGADHRVVRTPDNPWYWGGNFLAYDAPPGPGDVERWPQDFAAAFADEPRVRHMKLEWRQTDRDEAVTDAVVAGFTAVGFEPERFVTLTARQLVEPARPLPDGLRLEVIDAEDDAAWAALLENQHALRDPRDTSDGAFEVARNARHRETVRSGMARWIGVWDGDMIIADCGVVCDGSVRLLGGTLVETDPDGTESAAGAAGDAVARFQAVGVRQTHRRQGLASWIVWRAAQAAASELDAGVLVIVADADEDEFGAARIYRRLGFREHERGTSLVRVPTAQ